MTDVLLILALLMLAAVVVLQVLALRRRVGVDLSPLEQSLATIDRSYERSERTVREEMARNRAEVGDSLGLVRKDVADAGRALRDEVNAALKNTADTLVKTVAGMAEQQAKQFEAFKLDLNAATKADTDNAAELRKTVDAQLKHNAEQSTQAGVALRGEVVKLVETFAAGLRQQVANFSVDTTTKLDQAAAGTREGLAALSAALKGEVEQLRSSVETKLKDIREDNTKQLDQMRQTVDEKLQGTLEQRLGESFKIVSERLEAVQRGLGEMQGLANGVGDLKRVLTNVSTRGTWGEMKLHALLDQMLSPAQYETNVACGEDPTERVEFCIKLPDALLPVDSKFPVETYSRLQAAETAGDLEAVEAARSQLDAEMVRHATTICTKYINPPTTTPFAIMFLPTEGLYAEVVRRPDLLDRIQRQCRINIAGPTTLAALLNSLQMGFRTLAIAKRSDEVWALLGAVKTEWGKYGEALDAVRKKLDEAGKKVDAVAVRTRAVNRKLRTIEEMPGPDAMKLLEMDTDPLTVSADVEDEEEVASN
jgi:DNA recombination protein RmuC